MESRFFARACKILAITTLLMTTVDFKINFFGIPWHYYLVRTSAIAILLILALKSRHKSKVPLYYFDIFSYTLYAFALYGMVFIAPAYTFCFMHVFIAIGLSTQTTLKRFIIQSLIGTAACALGHFLTAQPKIIAIGVNAKPMMFIAASIFQIISGFIYIFITRFRMEINELNEKYALIGKRSSFLIHEIKSPLTRIMGQTAEGHTPVLENIHKESKRILTVIDSVEALIYRPEEISKTFEPFTLREIKEKVINDFGPYLQAINIELNFKNEDLIIFGHRALIYQLFKNLIDNAIEAIGYKENEKPLIHIYGEETSDLTIFKIRNTHSYIPQHLLKKAFYPHFTTKDKPSNKGLGLTLTKNIVEAHRGKIWIYSDQKKNYTEFEVKLPRRL